MTCLKYIIPVINVTNSIIYNNNINSNNNMGYNPNINSYVMLDTYIDFLLHLQVYFNTLMGQGVRLNIIVNVYNKTTKENIKHEFGATYSEGFNVINSVKLINFFKSCIKHNFYIASIEYKYTIIN